MELLANVWSKSTKYAPFSYAVGLKSFHRGIIPREGNDDASTDRQKLIAATEGADPAGFAHVFVSKVEADNFVCGGIRCLSFLPQARPVGEALLNEAGTTCSAWAYHRSMPSPSDTATHTTTIESVFSQKTSNTSRVY